MYLIWQVMTLLKLQIYMSLASYEYATETDCPHNCYYNGDQNFKNFRCNLGHIDFCRFVY